MKFNLTIEEFTLLINAIHYYKHVPKRGEFQKYDINYCETLRDKLAHQLVHEQGSICPDCGSPCSTCGDRS